MKCYQALKDSGVVWLGELPETWKTMKLARVVQPHRAITYGIVQAGPHLADGVPYIRPTDMLEEAGVVDAAALLKTSPEIAQSYRRSEINPGDIVCSIGPSFGKVMVVPEALGGANLTQGTARIAVNQLNDAKFIFWVLRSQNSYAQWESAIGGATFRALNLEPLAGTRIPSPPLSEQRTIADFLDRETAKIDDLVEEQRRLIALLAEKRQAVISHAVTKGLNPTAPLKPSGIDWLGNIPEGWEVCRLKDDLAFLTSGSRGWAEYYSDDGALFLRIGNLTRDEIGLDLEDIQRVEVPPGAEGERTRVRTKDLLFSITAFLGSVAVIPGDLEHAYVSQHVALARLRQRRLLPEWVAYVTLSSVGKNFLAAQGYGGTKIQLSLGDIGNLVVPVPSMAEQSDIIAAIELRLAHLAALAETATSAITLLQERRAALISAAVTGKIDVREALLPVVAQRQFLKVSAMVAGVVIAKLGRKQDHGRIWLQKLLFMAQIHANIDEIGGAYLRAPNGPLDISLRDRVESDLSAANAIRVTREPGDQGAYRYEFIADATQLRAELAAEIGDRMEGLLRLMDLLGDMGTKQIEAVATLYAAWNDFLIDGKAPSDADLVHEVLENWHPAKKERLSPQYLADQLGWMRRQDIVPSGTGRKTYTDRLL